MREQLVKLALMYDTNPSQVASMASGVARVPRAAATAAQNVGTAAQNFGRDAAAIPSLSREAWQLKNSMNTHNLAQLPGVQAAPSVHSGYQTGYNRFGINRGYSATVPVGRRFGLGVDQVTRGMQDNPVAAVGTLAGIGTTMAGSLPVTGTAGTVGAAAPAAAGMIARYFSPGIASRVVGAGAGYAESAAPAAAHAAKGLLGSAAHLAKDVGAWSGLNAGIAGATTAADNMLGNKYRSPLAAAGSAAAHTPSAIAGGHLLGGATGRVLGSLGRAEGRALNPLATPIMGRGAAKEIGYGAQRYLHHEAGPAVEQALLPAASTATTAPAVPASKPVVPAAPKPPAVPYMPGPSSSRGVYRY